MEFNESKYSDFSNVFDLISKTRYFHEKADVRDRTDNLSLKIVSFFVNNNNIKCNINDILKDSLFKDYSFDDIHKAISKLNEDNTVIKARSSGTKAKSFKDLLNSNDYKLDDKVYKFHKMAFDIANEVIQIKGSLSGDDIINFSKYFELLIDLLEKAYQGKEVDLNQLNVDNRSLFEMLFEESSGLYRSIDKKTEGLEESIANLSEKVNIIDDDESIYKVIEEFREIINRTGLFIRDINERVGPHIDNIISQFARLASIHFDSSIDKYEFYAPVVDSSNNLFIGRTRDDSIDMVIKTAESVLNFEESKSNVFRSLNDRLFNQISILYEISNNLMRSSDIIDNQIYFRNIALKIDDDMDKDELNYLIDSYFSTMRIEHFSVSDDKTIIGDNGYNNICFSLKENGKRKRGTRKKVKLDYDENEKMLLEIEMKRDLEEKEKRAREIKALFVDGVFVNKILSDEAWFFLKDTYYDNITEFVEYEGYEEFTSFNADMPGITFVYTLRDSDSDFKLESKDAVFILPKKDLTIRMLED